MCKKHNCFLVFLTGKASPTAVEDHGDMDELAYLDCHASVSCTGKTTASRESRESKFIALEFQFALKNQSKMYVILDFKYLFPNVASRYNTGNTIIVNDCYCLLIGFTSKYSLYFDEECFKRKIIVTVILYIYFLM